MCDCEDHCVVVYDASTLTHVRSFGSPGYEEGELSFPYSCAVIGSEVLVADVGNHRLSSFSRRTGKFVRCIGQEGDAPIVPEPTSGRAFAAEAASRSVNEWQQRAAKSVWRRRRVNCRDGREWRWRRERYLRR